MSEGRKARWNPPGRIAGALGCFLLFCLLLVGSLAAGPGAATALVRGEELVLSGSQLGRGAQKGVTSTEAGLKLDGGQAGVYTSQPLRAPLPFTDVGAQWTIDLPPGAGYRLELRTGPDGREWSDWWEVSGEPDWVRPESGEWVGDLVGVPQPERVHRYVQFRWSLTAAAGTSSPLIRQLRLAFIDGGVSPPAQFAAHSLSTLAKPGVISRTQWGCPDGAASPAWPPEYQLVTHVIVHHTVTPNDDTDHAARVRAIWYYHAITRGWGDIGYNYLVARDGSLYEGRAGGDDVIGGHASGYNPGSLGLAFVGTFVSDPVPQAMVAGAADLLAWKAAQKGIDPQGWGQLQDRWIRRISGHRDVGQTTCPGDVLYGQLQALRDEVSSRLDAILYTYVDDDQAVLGGPPEYWRNGPEGCGYGGHAYWTLSVGSGSPVNTAKWKPTLPQAGAYRVYAFVPYCVNGYPDSGGVRYRVHHAGGDTVVQVSHEAAAGGWVDLGKYNFDSGTSGYLYLDDVAVDSNRSIWADAVKWKWEGPAQAVVLPPTNTNPLDGSWSPNRLVAFRWSPSPSAGVDGYHLVIASDAGLTHVIKEDWVDYAGVDYWYTFAGDFSRVYWGVEAMQGDRRSQPAGPWVLGVDTVAPTAAVEHVLRFPDDTYVIGWSGQDASSGVANYDVEYQLGQSATWTAWLGQTTARTARWPGPVSQTVYFRVRARDVAGNSGVYDAGTANTGSYLAVYPMAWFPAILR